MAIPDYQAYLLPLLKLIADGKEYTMRDLTHRLADQFGLTPAEREEMLPSGTQTVIANRVGWTKTYLKKAGLLLNPTRGKVLITHEGRRVVGQNLETIDKKFLGQFASFQSFLISTATDDDAIAPAVVKKTQDDEKSTPEEAIEKLLPRFTKRSRGRAA